MAEEETQSQEEEPKPQETPPAASKADVDALRAELEAMRSKNELLETKLAAAPPAEEKPKELSRAELQEAVDNGTITAEKMEEVLDQQRMRKMKAEVTAEVRAELTRENSRAALEAEFDKYRQRIEGLEKAGHPNRERVSREYRELVRLGAPEGASTEMAALRATFGPAEKIREHTHAEHEAHHEAGASGGGESPSTGAAPWKKGLSPERVAHLESMIEKGQYSGPDDPQFKKYVEFAKSGKPPVRLAKSA